jgi:hypothetical protein
MDRRVDARDVYYGRHGEVLSPHCGVAYEVKAITKVERDNKHRFYYMKKN